VSDVLLSRLSPEIGYLSCPDGDFVVSETLERRGLGWSLIVVTTPESRERGRSTLEPRTVFAMRRLAPLALVLVLSACGGTSTEDVESDASADLRERLARMNTDVTLIDVTCDPLTSSDVGTRVQCEAALRNEVGERVDLPVVATILRDKVVVEPLREFAR
jgi:hypothetical protein